MRLTAAEIEEWAVAYVRAHQDPDLLKGEHPLWWTVEWFMPPLTDCADPEDCWKAILAVLAQGPDEKTLGVLAAGPLEDLVDYHGAQFIERIEREASRNPAFRQLLQGVWESGPPEVWSRVERAQKGVGNAV